MSAIRTVTGEQFDAMAYEEGRRWELMHGELIPVSSATPRHQKIVTAILLALVRCFQEGKLAVLVLPDVEFALTDRDRLRPDVCILLGEKARRLDLDQIPISGCPDIAIEVISPTERASESYDKVRTYLRGGTAEVWQVYPKSQTVQIHRGEISRSIEWTQPIESELLPSFGLRLSSLFD